jgi:hypothetical protein
MFRPFLWSYLQGGNIINTSRMSICKIIEIRVESFKTSRHCEINFMKDHSGSAMPNIYSLTCHMRKNVFETEHINLILEIILGPTTLIQKDLSCEVSK